MQQVYRFKHTHKKTYKRQCNLHLNHRNSRGRIRSWIVANPRSAVNYIILLATLVIVSTAIILITQPPSSQTNASTPSQTAILTSNDININTAANSSIANIATSTTAEPFFITKTTTIRKKDTLNKIFKRFGIEPTIAKTILASTQTSSLRDLHVGQKLTLSFAQNKQLEKLTYPINATDTLIVSKSDKSFQTKIDHVEPSIRMEYAALTIKNSFYGSAKRAGISNKLTAQLVNIFSTKTNLNKTLRTGDKIAFLYKDTYVKEKKLNKNSEILAAEYTHAGKTLKIVAFTDPQGVTNYYTADGYTLKSPFVRYPLAFRYIGSPFSMHRYNPVSHTYAEHTGIDLVAGSGTPIKASSSGVIAAVGSAGDGYGNKVIVKHGQYSALYAHMRGFAKGIHRGSFVRQGQVIGYVGMTGRATGPHLHYELRINGVPYNPATAKLPSGEMIAAAYRGKFFATRNKLLAQMNLYAKSTIAANLNAAETPTAKTS